MGQAKKKETVPNHAELIETETQRLQDVLEAIDINETERKKEIKKHDALIRDLEQQRLNSNNPREKDRLTLEIRRINTFDPAKYKIAHECRDQPYFAHLVINDNDPRIGRKGYLIGKQGVIAGTKALVIDWRKAALSQLFYDYEEGEEYAEDIVNIKNYSVKTFSLISYL